MIPSSAQTLIPTPPRFLGKEGELVGDGYEVFTGEKKQGAWRDFQWKLRERGGLGKGIEGHEEPAGEGGGILRVQEDLPANVTQIRNAGSG